ncbi:glycosyltransferase [soil metagenome]
MKILTVHNYYQQSGGEDQVFSAESALLQEHGHHVLRYTVHNAQIKRMSSTALTKATLWNSSTHRELRDLVKREKPHVAHFHNTFPLISPAGYYAARAEGVPVVQTLHNYRLLCSNAQFFRDGHVCEDCLGKTPPWPGIVHACYRGSRTASGVVAAMLTAHRASRTWTEMVDMYVSLTEFQRQKFIQGGIPEGKIKVKPNFVRFDPGVGEGSGGYVLFVGRLSTEKGIETLLAAWKRLGGRVPLKIAGDGPLAGEVARATEALEDVEWLGRQPEEQVRALMKSARALVFPSVWYEGFPMVIVEAYAAGLPVIASDLGSMSTLVEHGRTGLHFSPGDPKDLARKIQWSQEHPSELAMMGKEARSQFEAKYTAEQNYRMLMEIYELAMEGARGKT